MGGGASHNTARWDLGKRGVQQLNWKFPQVKNSVRIFNDKMCVKSSLIVYVHATVQQHTSLSHKHTTNTDTVE